MSTNERRYDANGLPIIKVRVNIYEKSYGDFLIRLNYDDFHNPSHFVQAIVSLYLEKEPEFMAIMNKVKDKASTLRKRTTGMSGVRRKTIQKQEEKEKEIIKRFELDERELEYIYDILEKDLPPSMEEEDKIENDNK